MRPSDDYVRPLAVSLLRFLLMREGILFTNAEYWGPLIFLPAPI